ncbi:Hypothetical predicted protein [Lecanosticta acicola]|uniref:Uncharacterized protein n=1 Tax=Lecanosticta acicola TaxID=111012 RepID=A0AAI8YTV0_9PEZI|nr:Hypothetical predicted protein [Lecanosticta acicola]
MPPKREASEAVNQTMSKQKAFKRLKKERPKSVPYNDGEEGYPPLPVYHPSFKKTENMVIETCDVMLETIRDLKERGFQDDKIDKFADSLNECRFLEKKYPPPKRIGFLGDMGAGKSSLINSLLGVNVTKESDGTKTGTLVIQEFVKARTNQPKAYEATIYFHNAEQIEKFVQEYFQDIYEELVASRDEHTIEDMDEYESRRDTALEFFMSLLGDQSDFRSKEAARTYFQSAIAEDQHAAVKAELLRMVIAYLDTLGCEEGRGIKTFSSNRLPEIHGEILKLCRPKGRELTSWPLISRIQIRLRSRLLDEGTMLVDLPGIADTNRARVDATMDYLKRCSAIVITTSVKRIADQLQVEECIKECKRLGKIEDTIVVATMTDIITTKEFEDEDEAAEEDEQRGWPTQDLKELKELREKVKDLEAGDDELEEELDDGRKKPTTAFEDRQQEIAQEIENAKARVEQKHIEMRNREAIRELQSRYEFDPPIPVFCVSNKNYQAHLRGYDLMEPPTLDVKACGIPSLRRMLYRFPAEPKMEVLSNICRADLPLTLNSLELCCGKPLSYQIAIVEKAIAQPKQDCVTSISEARQQLAAEFHKLVHGFILSHGPNWQLQAQKLCNEWTRHNQATFRAICKHNGQWVRKKNRVYGREHFNWNAELVQVMQEELQTRFDPLELTLGKHEKLFVERIDGIMVNLTRKLQTGAFVSLDLQPLFESFDIRRRNIASEVKGTFQKLRQSLIDIRSDVTASSGSGYVRKCLNGVYERCAQIVGTGAHKERSRIFHEKVDENIYLACGDRAKEAFAKALAQWESNTTREVLDGTLTRIVKDIENCLQDARCSDPRDQCFRDQLYHAVRGTKARLNGPLTALLDECAACFADEASVGAAIITKVEETESREMANESV